MDAGKFPPVFLDSFFLIISYSFFAPWNPVYRKTIFCLRTEYFPSPVKSRRKLRLMNRIWKMMGFQTESSVGLQGNPSLSDIRTI